MTRRCESARSSRYVGLTSCLAAPSGYGSQDENARVVQMSGRSEAQGAARVDGRRAWPRTAVLFVCIGVAYALVVVGLCGAGIWSARVQSIAAAKAQATAIATFSAAYTSRMYDIADEVGRRLAQDLSGSPLEPQRIAPLLTAAAEGTAQSDYFVVFDADGDLIASSEPMRPFKAQEDTLAAHRGGAARHLGQVVRSRGSDEIIYRLSHRVVGSDGRMTGIVGVAIRPFGIQATGQRAPEAPQVTVWTEDRRFVAAAFVDFRPNGTAVAPPQPPALGTTLPGQIVHRDGVIRAESRVEGFPLWVSADFDERGVLTTWRAITFAIVGLGVLLLLLGAAFAWTGLKVSGAEETRRALLARANVDAEASLRSRELLLKEIHHRVRNSLMLVSSFLMLQARGADMKTRAALERVQARVTSIGLVHETLYTGADVGLLDLSDYLDRLVPELSASLGAAERGIRLTTQTDDVRLGSDQATTLGLIVSEAVTNAVKYAFEGRAGVVAVTARRLATGEVELTVADDGVGRADDSKSGLGSRLLDSLARQLGGRCVVEVDGGTRVRVIFPGATPV